MPDDPNRIISPNQIVNLPSIQAFGITAEMIASAITYTYQVLDAIDEKMAGFGEPRLSVLIELANLSAIVGNLFGRGVANASAGKFIRNRPHRYPDLLAQEDGYIDAEIKVALESNKPKGHLAKPGPHLTVRYVLANADGKYTPGKGNRGHVVWIWEIRAGTLEMKHFNISNTAGDSGKTAVMNAAGMERLQPVFIDLKLCPYSAKRALFSALQAIVSAHQAPPPKI